MEFMPPWYTSTQKYYADFHVEYTSPIPSHGPAE